MLAKGTVAPGPSEMSSVQFGDAKTWHHPVPRSPEIPGTRQPTRLRAVSNLDPVGTRVGSSGRGT
jgi:hypothetical protein